ncbi:MAG TPA: hypothetical protein VKU41_21705 [Polyangiaceae bacterium]|nr:hypothetical protein [Polyangiaceae bacterium]
MKSALVIPVSLLLQTAAWSAHAYNANWQGPHKFDQGGTGPSVAVAGGYGMELHMGGGELWDHSPNANPPNPPFNLGSSLVPNSVNGANPDVATASDDPTTFIAEYADSSNYLHYALWTSQNGWYSQTGIGQQGFFPSIASADGTIAVEVHQGQLGIGSLWMNVGYASFGYTGGTYGWTGISTWVPYEFVTANAMLPSVSILNLTNSTYLIIVVMQTAGGANGTQPLESIAGLLTLQSGGNYALSWTSILPHFTTGSRPAVAICDFYQGVSNQTIPVLQVNEGPNGNLWSHIGLFTVVNGSSSNPTVSFSWVQGSDDNYDTGFTPKLGCENFTTGGYGVEVHQSGADNGDLFYREFNLQ